MNATQQPGAGDDARIEQVLAQLTLEEKAALTVGRDVWTTQPIERLGVPSVWVSDGPTGLRKVATAAGMTLGNNVPATCFPTASALGATWDVDLVREVGARHRRRGAGRGRAGAAGAGRQPEAVAALRAQLRVSSPRTRCCRANWPRPTWAACRTAAWAAASSTWSPTRAKPPAWSRVPRWTSAPCANCTCARSRSPSRKADPWTLMAAYNRLNGVYCAENRWLLHDVVAQEWGYGGHHHVRLVRRQRPRRRRGRRACTCKCPPRPPCRP